MKMSSSINELAKAMAQVQNKIENVTKDKKNPHLKAKYADFGSVLEICRPALTEHGLSIAQFPCSSALEVPITQTTVGNDGRERVETAWSMAGVTTLLMHESGQWISAEALMPLFSQKGNSLAQCMGVIITYLGRYAWSRAAGIAQVDDDGVIGEAPEKPKKALNMQISSIIDYMSRYEEARINIENFLKAKELSIEGISFDQANKLLSGLKEKYNA